MVQIIGVILFIITVLYLLSFGLGRARTPDLEKLSTYETGFNPISDARKKIDIIFWIIGLLYLIFDLEIIFLFPFASIIYLLNSWLAFSVFLTFIIIIALGFLYEYSQGVLNIGPVS